MSENMSERGAVDDVAASLAIADETGAAAPDETTTDAAASAMPRVSGGYVFWLMAASFGASIAMMVPLAYGLALRITELAPGHEEVLGYVTGSAQLVFLILSPMIGIWSDRTRSRLGRRTPFLFLGAVLGVIGALIIGVAPNLLLVGAGWAVAMVGWSTAGAAIQTIQADKLPEEQRGKVSALTGVMTQIAPVIGIGIAYAVSSSTMLVFLVPAIIGTVLLVLFPVFKPEGSSKDLPVDSSVTLKKIVSSYGFSVRRYPAFAWNWLGRFVFFFGLYFNTTFGTFFYAQRLDLPVREVAGVVATIGMLGIVAATAGALAGGFLSDKLKRRRLFVMIAALLFVGGAITEAFAWSLPQLIVGAVLMQMAIAVFATVDQAIVYAILPDRAEAGRYMAVVAFAQKIPSALAPLLAPLIITIGAVGGDKNYTLLYLSGAVLALVGGLIILLKVKAVR
ncbi:MFS transporter [Microbacterium ureisolvens]|uniref:MFS transporter n=1 Tax=Microbacterium ureisolvens TaxID=2781186 RepID=A0ABS7HY93_9MICO|nr:MFS transporter [Microbacterium ureisolvens]MBW9110347.1 MFS transporter [Microbacterium ureisolvens]